MKKTKNKKNRLLPILPTKHSKTPWTRYTKQTRKTLKVGDKKAIQGAQDLRKGMVLQSLGLLFCLTYPKLGTEGDCSGHSKNQNPKKKVAFSIQRTRKKEIPRKNR